MTTPDIPTSIAGGILNPPSPGPWLLFDPEGVFDGVIWSPRTLAEAQRKLARPQRWATLERQGWTVRHGTKEELRSYTIERFGADA